MSKKAFEIVLLAMAALLRGRRSSSIREQNCLVELDKLRSIYLNQRLRRKTIMNARTSTNRAK